jgi:hypothetical protein
VKISPSLPGLVLLTSICLLPIGRTVLAESSWLNRSRNLTTTGIPAAPPTAHQFRRLPTDATATIDFGNGEVATASCRRGNFERVGLRHDQVIDVSVQYPAAVAGKTIAVESLDGGQIIAAPKNLVVAGDGTIHFKFRVGHTPGVYQIALHNGARELGLQFWVHDDADPRNNPPVVNPAK